jgi:hypothetical protein
VLRGDRFADHHGWRAEHARPEQMIFVGVIDPINPRVETPEAL